MKEILSLVKLDLICLKKKSLIPLFIGMFIFALFGFVIGPHYAIPIILFSGLSVYTMFSIAGKNDFGKLYGMLPIRQSSVVYARFITCLVLLIACTVIMTLIAYASAEIGYFRNQYDMGEFYDRNISSGLTVLMTAALIFLSSCILAAIEFCMVFVFGVEREIPATIGCAMIAGAIIFILHILDVDIMEKIVIFFGNIMDKSKALFYIFIFALGIITMFLFAIITDVITKNREL